MKKEIGVFFCDKCEVPISVEMGSSAHIEHCNQRIMNLMPRKDIDLARDLGVLEELDQFARNWVNDCRKKFGESYVPN